MPKIERRLGERMTRRERLAVVMAILVSIGVHLVAFAGFGGITLFAGKEKKRERLMVIRSVRDTSSLPLELPPPRVAPIVPPAPVPKADPPTAKPPEVPPTRKMSDDPGSGPKPGEEEGSGKTEGSPEMEAEQAEVMLREAQESAATKPVPGGPHAGNGVSVVTDLATATFLVSGPVEQWGSGTYWLRKGLPPGQYTVTFQPAPGLTAPPRQSKVLAEGGQIVFVGKYTRNVEVVVDTDPPGAPVTIYRPDGKPVPVTSSGRYFVEDLPPGTYTAVYKDVPGRRTPAPQTGILKPGGALAFSATYADAGESGRGGRGGGAASGVGTAAADGAGGGSRSERARADGMRPQGRGRGAGSQGTGEGSLDRRVQMVVKSYPPTDIEQDYEPIPYPEVVIRKSRFQQGWCQVYLVAHLDDRGEVTRVDVERPAREDRARFESLIRAVEDSVRSWDYDRVSAEVHVDVRFYVE